MNDYKLINRLLEDGSPESLLKLKIINYSNEINETVKTINKIKNIENVPVFLKLLEPKFNKMFKERPSIIINLNSKIRTIFFNELVKCFEEQIKFNLTSILYLFNWKQQLEILTKNKDLFEIGFSNDIYSINYLKKRIFVEFLFLFKDSLTKHFYKKPNDLYLFNEKVSRIMIKRLGLKIKLYRTN